MSPVCAWVTALAVATGLASFASADEEPVAIPLNKIWALDMPGTRDIRELEPDKFGEAVKRLSAEDQVRRYDQSLIREISDSLCTLEPNQKAMSGFAVLGRDLDALREAHAILVEGRDPSASFATGSDVSVVFFSHPSGSYVHLQKVVRSGNKVEVQYRFVPHETREITLHLALIPVSAFTPGEVDVEIVRAPMEQRSIDAGVTPLDKAWDSRIVCQSFRFVVGDKRARLK